jgi:nitrogen-specific signal transduction histidine kinase/ActR/RegA family two-component response regulator
MGVVLVFRDITEQSRLEEQLRQSQKMDSIGQLAGGVAHDFNNMLGGIIGSAELLATRIGEDEKCSKFVTMIIDTAERAANLTGKLLAFSRKGKVLSSPVNIHGVIVDTIAILERSIDKRITIVHDLAAPHPIVIGDPSQIENAILNLGVNAGYAMPTGGTLILSTEEVVFGEDDCRESGFSLSPGPFIRITVQDEGVGMPPEVLERIFEPFFTTRGVGEGTGLGLSAVYGTVKNHHGAVHVESEEGQGTRVCLDLPCAVHSDAPDGEEGQEEVHSGSGHILVVDDEAVIRMTSGTLIRDLGYEVTLAEDGEEALDLYRQDQERFDLVILDMVMPKLNGTDTFRRLRELDSDARVLISSGFTRDAGIGDLRDEGLLGFIKKPYRRSELSQVLSEILASPQS